MSVKSVQFTAYFDPQLFAKLESIAKADELSVAYILSVAAMEFVAKPDNVAKWREPPGVFVSYETT